MHVHLNFLKELCGKFSSSMEISRCMKLYFFSSGSHIVGIVERIGVRRFFSRNRG
jgi:hypothetical protein